MAARKRAAGLRLDLTQYRDGGDEFDAVAVTMVNRF